MLFFVLAIIFFVVAVIAARNWDDDLKNCMIILTGICVLAILGFTCSSVNDYFDAKDKQLEIATEWTNSTQTEEDWQWVCDRMTEANEIAKKDHYGNKLWYALSDIAYAFGGYKYNLEMYSVTITENEIIFPEKYNKLPLRKREENKICQ